MVSIAMSGREILFCQTPSVSFKSPSCLLRLLPQDLRCGYRHAPAQYLFGLCSAGFLQGGHWKKFIPDPHIVSSLSQLLDL